MSQVTMRLLDGGVVEHDYGLGSCLSCGGAVCSVFSDSTGLENAQCPHCGTVEYVVCLNDTGEPLQGFMTLAERGTLSGWRSPPDIDEADIPY